MTNKKQEQTDAKGIKLEQLEFDFIFCGIVILICIIALIILRIIQHKSVITQ